jgi:CheY-like chemotaxis protein
LTISYTLNEKVQIWVNLDYLFRPNLLILVSRVNQETKTMVTDQKSILIVEDDLRIRELLSELLAFDNFKTHEAENGLDALTLVDAGVVPSLILLDLDMPVMNGQEFLSKKKERPSVAATPVIILSATADETNTAGATDYIRKPIDIDVLVEMIQKYV